MKKVTLGGKRLGSGNRMQVEQREFGHSSHDLSNAWRSSMSSGTLVPFMCQVALPNDKWEIKLNCDVKTHPTVGPLFGSYKVQLDVFTCPIRLYNSWIHNNKLGIGNKMQDVKIPQISLKAVNEDAVTWAKENRTMYPINNSHILKYLGLSGVGRLYGDQGSNYNSKDFNALPLLSYWDIFKNYYASKQEKNAYIIGELGNVTDVVNYIEWSVTINSDYADISNTPMTTEAGKLYYLRIYMNYDTQPNEWNIQNILQNTILTNTNPGGYVGTLYNIFGDFDISPIGTTPEFFISINTTFGNTTRTGNNKVWIIPNPNNPNLQIIQVAGMAMTNTNGLEAFEQKTTSLTNRKPRLQKFELTDIDVLREDILKQSGDTVFNVGNWGWNTHPTNLVKMTIPKFENTMEGVFPLRYSQQGLLVKTYQSDIFNNWLNEETVSGNNGINEITRVDTSAGYFDINSLIYANKVYNMLNDIAAAGGSFDDWQETVYNHERFKAPEIPIYEGGLSKELVFDEVWSNAQTGNQPLGTLAGRGVMSAKHKGGNLHIQVNEISYIIGIVSITPRIDYSQGNDWSTDLKTWNDFHKPHLDQIGFQDLLAKRLAWFGTIDDGHGWTDFAIGKQPAWVDYMTNYNRTFGSFAEASNEMFMTLNRRYLENSNYNAIQSPIADATQYIDPSKFNNVFAQTSLDAQNCWVQIAQDTTVRRLMSAKIMPNL